MHATNAAGDEHVHGDMLTLPHAQNQLNVKTNAMVWSTTKQHDPIVKETPSNVINTNIEHNQKIEQCDKKMNSQTVPQPFVTQNK